jgi:hypothetical protein
MEEEGDSHIENAVKHWCDSGLAEHSSVAGFSKVLVGLVNVNAPSIILRASQNAALDEIKHAKLCFGLANAIRSLGSSKKNDGRVLSPGPLPVKTSLKVHTSLDQVAGASAAEGCVEETLSSFLAAVALDMLPESDSSKYIPKIGNKVSFVLNHITRDESRHASLAWYTVRWCLEEERKHLDGKTGVVHKSVREAFAKAFENVVGEKQEKLEEEVHDSSLWPYGILSANTEHYITRIITREVLKPWAIALLNFRPLPEVKISLVVDPRNSNVHTNRVLNTIRSMEMNADLLNLDAKFSDE